MSTSAWWTSRSIIAGGDDVVGKGFAPSIWGWHLFVSVETRSSLGLQHVFAF